MKPLPYSLKSDKQTFTTATVALLTANPDVFGASAMEAASAKLAEEEQKEATEKAFLHLKTFSAVVRKEVEKLKALRAAEAAQRKRVKTLDKALKAFKTENHDSAAFLAVANSLGIH